MKCHTLVNVLLDVEFVIHDLLRQEIFIDMREYTLVNVIFYVEFVTKDSIRQEIFRVMREYTLVNVIFHVEFVRKDSIRQDIFVNMKRHTLVNVLLCLPIIPPSMSISALNVISSLYIGLFYFVQKLSYCRVFLKIADLSILRF